MLVELRFLFVLRVLAARVAVLAESEFFCRIDLVAFGDVVLTLTYLADETDADSLCFFCHGYKR